MRKLEKILIHLVLIIISFISLFPFLWMLISATNSHVDIIAGKITFGPELISNFVRLFEETGITQAFSNSVFIAIFTVTLQVFISSLAAYGFQFFPSKFSQRVYAIFILSMMIPFSALMIPMFKLSGMIGIFDTYFGLILTTALNVFLIFFFRQNFKSLPVSLIEAARIDGKSEFGIFVTIVFPIMKTTFAAATIFSFIGNWNNYLWPLIFMQSNDKFTLPIYLSNLSSGYTIDYSLVMCAIVISTIPVVIIFLLLQKHFINGMLGSVK